MPPIANQQIGSTQPKSGTFQWNERRIQGIPFKIGATAGVTECSNNRIVSLQEDANGNRFAVLSNVAQAGLTIIGWGVLEEALQSSGVDSIAPSPNTFKDGDMVTVLTGQTDVFMVDIDTGNAPVLGIGTAYIDAQGRVSGLAAGNVLLVGSIFNSTIGSQMANQQKANTVFFKMGGPVHA